MSPRRKPRAPRRVLTPIEIFRDNIADADQLVRLVRMLENQRVRSMRAERQETMGKLLAIPKADHGKIDGVESEHLYIVLKPGSEASIEQFTEDGLRPLLRQAIVAISAAIESYVADKSITYVSQVMDLSDEDLPPRLDELRIGFKELLVEIERAYERTSWGYRERLKQHLREKASPAASSIGVVFSTVGIKKFPWNQIDQDRKVESGQTMRDLNQLYLRRNKIAHQADREGARRYPLSLADVESYLQSARNIVEGMEKHLPAAKPVSTISAAPISAPGCSDL